MTFFLCEQGHLNLSCPCPTCGGHNATVVDVRREAWRGARRPVPLRMSPEAAKTGYRAAWIAHTQTDECEEKLALEFIMDSLQSSICKGPGPEWHAFTKTLPGFPVRVAASAS